MERRAIVNIFADAMEEILRRNDFKGDWRETCSYEDLMMFLRQEVLELESALYRNKVEAISEDVMDEAIDVANLAMMIYDLARIENLRSSPEGKEK